MEIVGVFFLLLCLVLAQMWAAGQWAKSGYAIVGDELATYLADCDLRLFDNNVTVTSNLLLTDLQQATFVGYAAKNYVTVPAPVRDPVNGGISSFLGSTVFTCTTAPAEPMIIYGWYLTDTGGALIAAGNLPAPITISRVDDSVPLQVTLNYPG